MDLKNKTVVQKIKLLVDALDGAQETNEALSRCQDGESMVELLLVISSDMGLGLTRQDLVKTPPIRDWIWWKNKEALVTIGTGTPRHQQDTSGKTRWDSWSVRMMSIFKSKD